MDKLDLGTRDQIEKHLLDHRKSKGIPKNICFIVCAKAFDGVDNNKLENS